MNKHVLAAVSSGMLGLASFAQVGINYDESKVPAYTLPELLVTEAGETVTSVAQWEARRRPELLELFAAEMYGRTPNEQLAVRYEVLVENKRALDGKATSRQVKFVFSDGKQEREALLLLFLPNGTSGRVPVFVGYNFKGNHSTIADTAILYSTNFALVREPGHPDWERGNQSGRWAFHDIIDRGYAVATMCYHDIFPDKPGMESHSVMPLFADYANSKGRLDVWQAIGAWAWGSSRIIDYLATEPLIDTGKVAIMGHSRQGKAALWAGAQDSRFKVVISNNSGEGGAAISRRRFGESIARVSSIEPAWFCEAFNRYRNRELERPIEQHQLIALMAPRAVYVASAEEDLWADPKGEYLGAYHAGPAYALYGLQGLKHEEMPAVHAPEMHRVGYHIRAGKHDVTAYDWQRFLDFADMHFRAH